VQICAAETGLPLRPRLSQPNAPRQIRFSPDGKRLVTACAKTGVETGFALLWNVATGEHLGRPMGHLDDLLSVEFSHDGKKIITGCDDRTARLWDAFSGEPVVPPLWHASKVIDAIFAPDDRYVVTLTARGDLQLWSATTGEAITRPLPHPYVGEAGHLSYLPGGHQLLIATGADEVWMREFVPSVLSMDALSLEVQVLSGQRVDPVVGLIPLEPVALSNAVHSWRADASKR
jgi:WD40 repeat protein